MPITIGKTFEDINQAIDQAHASALNTASLFTTDAPRDQVVSTYTRSHNLSIDILAVRDLVAFQTEARIQWSQPTLNWPVKAQSIIDAADAVTDWIQANFPTVRSTLDAAMGALSISGGQQNAIRAQMGSNLNYLLVHQAVAGAIVVPTIPAAALAPLVTMLNQLASVTTIP